MGEKRFCNNDRQRQKIVTTINNIQDRLRAFDVVKETKNILEKTKGQVTDLNRERMLEGKRADGSQMPNYSPISVSVYGYPPGPIRLRNTGAFQRAIKIDITANTIIQESTDFKSDILQARYGEKIFGMDKESKAEYANSIRPLFIKHAKEKLQL